MYKDVGGCQLIYGIKSLKIVQEGWRPLIPLCKDFAPWALWMKTAARPKSIGFIDFGS
jgi:hypothetical protein